MKASDKALLYELLGATGRDKLAHFASIGAIAEASGDTLRAQGLTQVQLRRLTAAFQVGERALEPTTFGKANCPGDVFMWLRPRFAGLKQEAFIVLGVNAANDLIFELETSRGSLTNVEVHPREVFRPLILACAAAFVVAHNHPSGDPTPSEGDLDLTRRLHSIGELLGIPLVDHVVVAGNRYKSIAELTGI